MIQFLSNSPEQTMDFAHKIAQKLQKGTVIALDGTLAAGKTTFVKGFAHALHLDVEITSPTYTIVSEYEGKIPLYHIDVYRLENEQDFIDLGGEDFLYGDGICVIEWSEKIKSILPANTIFVHIAIEKDNSRTIVVTNWQFGTI